MSSRNDVDRTDGHAQDESANDAPARERRSKHRVANNQQSGQGALTALSKLQMIERHRAQIRPAGSED
jgi:hypothetical protein